MKKVLFFSILLVSLVVGLFVFAFSEEPISTFEKIENFEEKIEFVKTLSLRDVIILGSQNVDKWNLENGFYFAAECLGPRWQADPSTIPETISIVLKEKLNPEWKKFLLEHFKNTTGPLFYEQTYTVTPFLLKYIENDSKDPKTKKVLFEIIGCWFDGYKTKFSSPQYEYTRKKENYEIVNKQASAVMDTIAKVINDKSENKEIKKAAMLDLEKINGLYIDSDNVLPNDFKELKNYKRLKSKSQELLNSISQ